MLQVCRSSPVPVWSLLISSLVLAFPSAESAWAQGKERELPQSTQNKIKDNLKNMDGDLLVFDKNGDLTARVTKDQFEGYKSPEDMFKSENSPTGSCKNPAPTPPPPCIVCDNGHVVCSSALTSKFHWNDRPRQSSVHPENKTPDSAKPQ